MYRSSNVEQSVYQTLDIAGVCNETYAVDRTELTDTRKKRRGLRCCKKTMLIVVLFLATGGISFSVPYVMMNFYNKDSTEPSNNDKSGDKKDIRKNLCSSNPCLNGFCQLVHGGYRCVCLTGSTGVKCENDVTQVEVTTFDLSSTLTVNGKARNIGRGLTVMVFDKNLGKLVTEDLFDTYDSGKMAEQAITFLKTIERGSVVILFSTDEIERNMGSLRDFIANTYNSKEIGTLKFRDIWCCVAYQRGATIYERVSKRLGEFEDDFPYIFNAGFQIYSDKGIARVSVMYG